MYTLLVCADQYGEKTNLELTFASMPTMGELFKKINEAFSAEGALKRPAGYPAVDFATNKVQIYDDVLLRWTDLISCSQLHEFDQLYAFQPQSPWHIDVQKDLPPPRPPTTGALVPFGMADNQRSISGYGDINSQARYGQFAAAPAYQGQLTNVSYNAPGPATSYSRGIPQTAGALQLLEDQRRKEDRIRMELQRVHEETERLTEKAAFELEDEQRRQQEERERILKDKEREIQYQRDALRRAEEELARLQQSTHGASMANSAVYN